MFCTYHRLASKVITILLSCGMIIGNAGAQTPTTARVAEVVVPTATLDCTVRQQAVEDFLRSLSSGALTGRTTNVKIVTAPDAATERISVFAKQMPLYEVLKNVAVLYGWDWSATHRTDGTTVLLLGPSPQQKVRERRQWNHLTDAAFLPIQEGIKTETQTAREQSAAVSNTAAIAESQDSREQEDVGRKAESARNRFYGTLSRLQKQQLLQQQRLSLPWTQLTNRQRDFAIAVVMPVQFNRLHFVDNARMTDVPTKEERAEFAKEFVSRLIRTGVTLSVDLEPVTGVVLGFRVGGGACVPNIAEWRKFEETLPPVRGNPYITTDKDITAKPDIVPSSTAAVSPHEDYAELERVPFPDKLNLVAEDTWSDVVSKLAKAVDKPIFSDGYSAARAIRPVRGLDGSPILALSPPPDVLFNRAGNLAAGLDALCRAYNMVWWQQNGALFSEVGRGSWSGSTRYL